MMHAPRVRSRRATVGAAVLTAVTLLVGCTSTPAETPAVDPAASDFDALVEAAQAEGTLTFYSSSPDFKNAALATAFQEKYGITIETLRLPTGGLLERLGGEQAAGVASADIVMIADEVVFETNPEWFLEVDAELIPEIANYPDDAVTDYYVLAEITPATIQYNTDMVKGDDIPREFSDLADPKWQGQLLFTDPRATPTYMGWSWAAMEEWGVEYLEALRDNDIALVDSANTGAQQVAAGAYAINFPAATSHSAELKAQGAPIDYVVVSEVANSPAQNMALIANAPHPNAARLFMNFRLSAEGASIICEISAVTSPHPDAEGCVPTPAGWAPIPFEVFTDDAKRQTILDALGIVG